VIMAEERVYNHARRVCGNMKQCSFPLCECPPAKTVEVAEYDADATRAALKESRKRHTVRVKSILP